MFNTHCASPSSKISPHLSGTAKALIRIGISGEVESGEIAWRSLLRMGAAIFLLAFGIRLMLVFALKTYLHPVGSEMERIIISLAQRGEFADPFPIHTGPTAHYTPLYPLLITPLYWIFGYGKTGQFAHNVGTMAMGCLQYALLPFLAVAAKLPVRIGIVAGLLGALIPANFLSEVKMGESLTGVLLIVTATILIRVWRDCSWSGGLGLRHGLWWGALILSNPSGLMMIIGALAAAWLRFKGHRRSVLLYAGSCLVSCFLVLLPWGVRNQLTLGKFIVFRSNLGLELAVSNNDLATPTFEGNVRSGAYDSHPYVNDGEAMMVRKLGEVAYHRTRMNQAGRWIASHPMSFAKLTIQRIVVFWFPFTIRPWQWIFLWLVSGLAFSGLWHLGRINRDAAQIFGSILLVFPLPYYVVQGAVRYRFQIQWLLYFLAATLLIRLYSGVTDPAEQESIVEEEELSTAAR